MQELNIRAAALQDKLADLHSDYMQSSAREVGAACRLSPAGGAEGGHEPTLAGAALHAPIECLMPARCNRCSRAARTPGLFSPAPAVQASPQAAAVWQQQWELQVRNVTAAQSILKSEGAGLGTAATLAGAEQAAGVLKEQLTDLKSAGAGGA